MSGLNHNEGSRAHVLSGGIKNELAGMHKSSSRLGSLHPSNFCRICGRCYCRPECVIGDPNLVYLGRGLRDAFRRILRRGE